MKLSREQLKSEARKLQNIVKSGKIVINGRETDIAEKLNMHESKEYRKDDITNIDITKYARKEKECKYTIVSEGSDTIAFNNKFEFAEGERMCILNFASSFNPGGGFENGAMAQEEALCQASNLYSIISKHNEFYEYNIEHKNRSMYSDGIIFTKNCLFFRNKYENTEPVLVDVITCAAPNFRSAREKGVKPSEIESTMRRRIEQILKVAIENNVSVLALGAFGCGVFGNDATFVASEMKTLLHNKHYGEYFKEVIFPMNEAVGKNVSAFLKEFKALK